MRLFVVGIVFLNVATIGMAVGGAIWWKSLAVPTMPLLPTSIVGLAQSVGVAPFVFTMHSRMLPPLMQSPQRYKCVSDITFCSSVIANIFIGLFGGPVVGAVLRTPTTAGTIASPEHECGPKWLMISVRWCFFLANILICPTAFAPALEQIRRMAPQLLRSVAALLLLSIAASLGQMGGLGNAASFVGGVAQCTTAFVLPASLAIWALPWQSSCQTALRALQVVIGLVLACVSIYIVVDPWIVLVHIRVPM